MKMLVVLSTLLSFSAFAESKIVLKNSRIKFNPPMTTITAAFVSITNHLDQDVELLSVEGDFAKTFELHDMEMKDGIMRMRKMPSILIKKHSTTELKSGGLHVMVFDLKKPLKRDTKYKLKFNFSNNEALVTEALVN